MQITFKKVMAFLKFKDPFNIVPGSRRKSNNLGAQLEWKTFGYKIQEL